MSDGHVDPCLGVYIPGDEDLRLREVLSDYLDEKCGIEPYSGRLVLEFECTVDDGQVFGFIGDSGYFEFRKRRGGSATLIIRTYDQKYCSKLAGALASYYNLRILKAGVYYEPSMCDDDETEAGAKPKANTAKYVLVTEEKLHGVEEPLPGFIEAL